MSARLTPADIEHRVRIGIERLRPLDPQRIILFGSAARGDVHDYSDIDLCIIHETSERFTDRILHALTLLAEIPEAQPVCYTPAEFERMARHRNPFIDRILREGRVVYER
jgi:predicted nucleotidyltransferase